MAPLNGAEKDDDREPPPSSMLATHVIRGNGVPHLNRDNFILLLEESLSTDEQGHPNLGQDVGVNHKLIQVVLQVGIEPLISHEKDDPFGNGLRSGRNARHLKSCLDVLQLAIERTPEVVFQAADLFDKNGSRVTLSLNVTLIIKMLALGRQLVDLDVVNGTIGVIATLLKLEAGCVATSCTEASTFLYFVLQGTFARSCFAGA